MDNPTPTSVPGHQHPERLRIVIAGGTGFIGRGLIRLWHQQHDIVVLSRMLPGAANNAFGRNHIPHGVQLVQWDGVHTGDWVAHLEGCDVLINLAGQTVNCIYNEQNKTAMLQSRVDTVRALGQAIAALQRPPALLVQIASATIYRHATDHPHTEHSEEMDNDFSVQVCKAWEGAFNSLVLPATRKVVLRLAITLKNGGVLVPFERLVHAGLGGRQGSGNQMFSWIHMNDVAGIIEWLWRTPGAAGVYNAAAPEPVTNRVFLRTLRQTLRVAMGLPLPEWFLKIAVPVFCTEPELLLKSRWVLPERLLSAGYTFAHPNLEGALQAIYLKEPETRPLEGLKLFKVLDILIQLVALVFPLLSFGPVGWLGCYIAVGAVQLASAGLNALFVHRTWKSVWRNVYQLYLLAIAVLLYLLHDNYIPHALKLNLIMVTSPLAALGYFTLTCKEFMWAEKESKKSRQRKDDAAGG
ncbi:MAG: TIGR01777 family protein [Chitinophagia bacterium]|nr:TIGR01777 family protein [Chitinophagia bacterium]